MALGPLWDTTTAAFWGHVVVECFGDFPVLSCLSPRDDLSGVGEHRFRRLSDRQSSALRSVRLRASKLAPVGLARTLAVEVGPLGGRVKVVSPGPVEGDRIERVLANRAAHLGITIQVARERLLSGNSLGWFVTRRGCPYCCSLPRQRRGGFDHRRGPERSRGRRHALITWNVLIMSYYYWHFSEL